VKACATASRLAVWVRILTAFPLGYAATSLLVMALARLLPGDRAQVTVTVSLLSFALYAALVVFVFAARSAGRALLTTALIGAVAGGITWASIVTGGRL
jgi:hypothetical protein